MRAGVALLGVFVGWLGTGSVRAEEPASCQDPLYLQTEARITDYATSEDKARAWEEFLFTQANNPCAPAVRAILKGLRTSQQMQAENAEREKWQQQSRGGVIEPNRDEFPIHQVFPDAPPVHFVRVLTEAVWLGDGVQAFNNQTFQVKRDALWSMVVRGEAALMSSLALGVDLPILVGEQQGEGLTTSLGNVAVRLRGIWGQRLSDGRYPWVITGGIVWGSGSSALMGADRRQILDAAAVGMAHQRHLYRYDSPDYAFQVVSQIGFGSHFLGAGLTYHIFAGGEHVEKIARIDLAWDWRLTDWIDLGLELNAAVGDGEPTVGATANELLLFVFAAPVVRVNVEWFSAAVSLRVPLGDAREWTRLVSSLEFSARL
jgi:hypothetical protein